MFKLFGFATIIVIVLLFAISIVTDKSDRKEIRYYNAVNGSFTEESSDDKQITITIAEIE
ncbi:hypothetical protein [Enterococcus sp. DIV0421]|uniref:hypothetical protein n=1 Tax=Enterococcus sp. DIV0421 TaxID=2774688 RepID=UPI003F688451